ncbi:hypothetical protein BGZ49_002183 [Haplosporangium sp. Z 27]|nr:hypothetical protein BGZ49_002183 [Haplosporangium sp. Z 27]
MSPQWAITQAFVQSPSVFAITASKLVMSLICALCHGQLIRSSVTLAEVLDIYKLIVPQSGSPAILAMLQVAATTGHLARNCRNQPRYNGPPRNFGTNTRPSNGASNGRVFCYKCGGANHFSRDCKASDVKCYNCNGFGHLSRDCPEGPKAQICYKCQQEGHISRDCPQP